MRPMMAIRPGSFDHKGAYSTNPIVEMEPDFILVWLVQHTGFPGNEKDRQEGCRPAALKRLPNSESDQQSSPDFSFKGGTDSSTDQ